MKINACFRFLNTLLYPMTSLIIYGGVLAKHEEKLDEFIYIATFGFFGLLCLVVGLFPTWWAVPTLACGLFCYFYGLALFITEVRYAGKRY